MITSTDLNDAMRSICSHLQVPVIVILLCICAISIIIVGTLIAERIFERRHLKVWMPRLVDELKRGEIPPEESIRRSALLKRQKIVLIELTDHKDLTDTMREALAVRLLQESKSRYDTIVKISDTITKIGPALGLLGTLIPLGPGIIAMGQGDTYTLSQSLRIAFDTTIIGLTCGCVNMVVSTIRKKWYTNDMSILETLMECILEVEKTGETGIGFRKEMQKENIAAEAEPLTSEADKTETEAEEDGEDGRIPVPYSMEVESTDA